MFVATAVVRTRLAHLRDEGRRARFLAQVTARAGAVVSRFQLDYVRLNLAARRPSSR
jgi:hypothetical protein